jgi:5,5'-dehydrodivanillate O-demethylase
MITAEENDLLTRIGPGTPMGEIFRRYWHPIGGASELTGKTYTKMVRLLGEDLVLYKDRSGTYGLIEPLCAHRRINLLYGVPLAHGLRCPYHGWAYDETGACIEIVTERDKTLRFGGPAAKYSPITPEVQDLFAQARALHAVVGG